MTSYYKKFTFYETSIFLMLVLLFLFVQPSYSDEGNIVFTGNRVKIYFQPRVRANLTDYISPEIEIGRLNYAVNTLDNYLEYLIKLKRVASNTTVEFDYNPEGGEVGHFYQRTVVAELGMNLFLNTVNEILTQKFQAKKSGLITNKDAFENLGIYVPLKNQVVEQTLGFTNLSQFERSLLPDMDFAVISSTSAVVVRSSEQKNELIFLSSIGSKTTLITSAPNEEFCRLKASKDGRYVAFTSKMRPMVISMKSKKVVSLFSNEDKKLQDWEWSPSQNLLSGIIFDPVTTERQIFVYDAETEKMIDWVTRQAEISGNYQFAYPYWSFDAKKILYCSGDEIHLIDLEAKKVFPKLVCVSGEISEILWAPDGKSFAFTVVKGQTRGKSEFNDFDFQGCSLHRYRQTATGAWVEDLQQQTLSKHTIKLVAFWTQDRVLFLEGKLKTPRVQSCLWDIKNIFAVRLTSGGANIGPSELPMEYGFAFKNLDGKFKNVYNSGLGHQNHLFVGEMKTLWLLGLAVPAGIKRNWETFCLRSLPYPFVERNIVILPELKKDELFPALDFFKAYLIRRWELHSDFSTVFFLSNSCGPLSLWVGNIKNFIGKEVPKPSVLSNEIAENEAISLEVASPTQSLSRFTTNGNMPLRSIPDLPSSLPALNSSPGVVLKTIPELPKQ